MENKRLKKIFDKTDGYCHLCHKKLRFEDYQKGLWQIEHSKPKAKGGSDHLNNLYAACTPCNTEKGIRSSRSVRKKYSKNRAPYSKTRKAAIRKENTTAGAIVGGFLGIIGGPFGLAIGATLGGMIGNGSSPKV